MSRLEQLSDEELVEKIQTSKNAFAEIVRRHERLLWQVIGGHSAFDDADIRDILQDTYVFAFQRLDNFDSDIGTLTQWLCKIARSRTYDFLRRCSSQNRKKSGQAEAKKCLVDHEREQGKVSIIDAVMANQVLGQLKEMDPECHDVVVMCHVQGLSSGEAAALRKIPSGTLRSKLSRGLNTLRIMVEADIKAETS